MAIPTAMEDELFRAAVNGDVSFLSEENMAKYGEAHYKDQTTPKKNNIIHIAAEHGRVEFIRVALARFPELGRRKNGNMDTPLHVAAGKGNEEIVRFLVSVSREGCVTRAEVGLDEEEDCSWMAKNLQGQTPLHLALSNNKLKVAMILLQLGSHELLSMVNDCQETPLHVFLKYCFGTQTSALLDGVMNLQGWYKSKCNMTTRRSLSSPMMIKNVLVQLLNCNPATYMVDAEGLTPLLLAAQQGNLMALRFILKHSPQSADLGDNQGRTLLHHLKSCCVNIDSSLEHCASDELETGLGFQSTCYWQLSELLKLPEIDAIKDAKDYNGNTPAHVALVNKDFVLVKVLFEYFADFTIKNKHGVSALDLIKSCPDFATKMAEVNVTEKVLGKLLEEKLIQVAKKGDETVFQNRASEIDIESGEVAYPDYNDHFVRRTRQGHSLLHIAVKHGHQTFVEEAIKYFPALVFTADLCGETPLHVGAKLKKNHYPVVETLLQLTQKCVNNSKAETGPLYLGALPWRQKNFKGDTPLHEALRSSNYDLATKLIEIDSELCSFENNAGETPLHILARYSIYSKSDKIGAMVKLLMSQNENVVYRQDSHGFTPLLTAAHCGRIRVAYWIICNCPTSLQFQDHKGRNFLHLLRLEPGAELDAMTVEDMLYVYTNILVLTSEVECDGCQGPILMPLRKYRDFRKLTGAEFDFLRSSQDQDGNTPLHYALKNKNFGAAKFLLHWCLKSEIMQEMTIINNDGKSVLNLLELLVNKAAYWKELKALASLAQEKTKEEAFGKKMMEEEVYKKAVKGDVNYFFRKNVQNQDTSGITRSDHDNGDYDSKFLSQVAPDGSNILHIAIQHGQEQIAKKVMEHYPHLIWERNSNGETPVHTVTKLWLVRNELYDLFEAQWEEACRKYHDSPSEEGFLIIPPWRVKNSQGNTPLHEVTKSGNMAFLVRKLLRFDFEVTAYVNLAGDTPLHTSTIDLCTPFFSDDMSDGANEYTRSVTYVQDREGLTPLLRAAKVGNTYTTTYILGNFPESIQLRDDRGKSFLHFLRLREGDEFKRTAERIYEHPMVDALLSSIDFDGNTPLHSAIQDGNYIGAKLLSQSSRGSQAYPQLVMLNNEGKSVLDLLASHDDAPTAVLQHLISKSEGANVHGFYVENALVNGESVRSGYGVCRSQTKDMANTLSVVAGLLATITFAAAFQVPGGFDGGSGSPILVRKAAFKVFMISNSLAMCGSMTVLFFLLWVMLTGSITTSFLLLDMSIAILQLSFGATLLSFMTGVYMATSHKALSLAIFICVLCSTMIVLLRKNFVLPVAHLFKLGLHRFGRCKMYGLRGLLR